MDLNNLEIQIFVSCPSDVNSEKKIVKDVCEIVNKDLLETKVNIHYTFRDFTEIIGQVGIRPQQLINDSITGYDIYLGILFMRFGTPTGKINISTGKEFESGTEEEYFEATKNYELNQKPKQIYFFFKNQKGSSSSIQNSQAGKVLKFKESLMLKDWGINFKTKLEFRSCVTSLLTRNAIELIKQLRITEKNKIKEDSSNKEVKIEFSNFVPILPDLTYYIPRSVKQFIKTELEFGLFSKDESEKALLKNILLNDKRVVLLGNAGSGKSVELQRITKYFLDPATPLIPIYKRFNTYTDERIEDFLPKGWSEINPQVLILVLDGLDEIQPQHFNTAIRKIVDFSESHSNLSIIISCRTNFYDPPEKTFSGTLSGFQVYSLNDVSFADIKDYTTKEFGIDGENFIQEASRNSFLNLIQQPFFLGILLKYYKENKNLTANRNRIIEDFIISRIEFDQEHYKTIDIPKTQQEILTLLERVAFVMELTGKNYVSDIELQLILSKESERNQIKHFSAFSKVMYKNHWMFEHNNIQEFLAARILGREKFEKIITIISFHPTYNKIKPTWVNTISFFISIGEPSTVSKLIDWLVEKEPEIIVKFEASRISKKLRIQLFKQIFNFYKEKNIWIYSNKFNENELARFASSNEAIEFLLLEIQDQSNTQIVRRNAINILDNFDLDDFMLEYKERTKVVLRSILDSENPDSNMIYSILYSMGKMGITDLETIKYVVGKYAKRKNQYIRAGLYKIINESDFLEQHVDVFLEGLNLNGMEGVDDRESVNLADESWQLEEGLKKIESVEGLKRLLTFFNQKNDSKRLELNHYKEIFEIVLYKSIYKFSEDNSLYDDIYEVYKTSGKFYDKEFINVIIPFFEKTGTRWRTFNSIWFDDTKNDSGKNLLLEELFDENVIDNFIENYCNRNFTNQDAEKVHQLLYWHNPSSGAGTSLIEYFERKIERVSDIKLEILKTLDWAAINKQRQQKSFDILFSPDKMLSEIKNTFKEIGKENLNHEDLWGLRRKNSDDIDNKSIPAVLELLRNFTTNGRTISYNDMNQWLIGNSKFEDYQIEEIYKYIHRSTSDLISISEDQKKFIKDWCIKIAGTLDIENAVYIGENLSTFVNPSANYLWFFTNHFKIFIPEKKLLDFTLFYDYEKQNESKIIENLESFLSIKKLEKRVIENLSKNIPVISVWESNAMYSVNRNLKQSFPHILRDLNNDNKGEYQRYRVLEVYLEKTQNFEAIQNLLENLSRGKLNWLTVALLIKHPSQHTFLIKYLKKIIRSESELFDDRLSAAEFLMQLNDLGGLNFVSEIIFHDIKLAFDFRDRFNSLSHIRNIDAVPKLLRILKIAKGPIFKKDKYNNLESIILTSLYNIGIESENNYFVVKAGLEEFINENESEFENLNFLYSNVQRIEQQLYLNKSQNYSVKEALEEFQKL